jgi:uncharacterized RDD family membrane protein YckC
MAYQGTPSYSGAPASQYSDWIHRVGAYLVETLPPLIVFYIFVFAVHVVILDFVVYLAFLAYVIYNRWILGGQGQSIGKKVLGMTLLSEETGQPIGTLNAFLRDICHIIDSIICYVGYLFPLWDPKRQTIADKIMKTVVVPVSQ